MTIIIILWSGVILTHYFIGGLGSESSGCTVRSRCYLVNCPLPGGPECETRSFLAVEDITRASQQQLKRTVCAMMNLGKKSTVFIGVMKDGTVKGVKLNKHQVCTMNRYLECSSESRCVRVRFHTRLLC